MLGKIETIVVVVVFVLNVYFALRVYFNNDKSLRNKFFSIYTLFLAGWIGIAYLSEFFPISSPDLCIFLSKISLSLSLFFVYYLLRFSLTYSKKFSEQKAYIIGKILFLPTTVFAVMMLATSYIVQGIEPLEYSFNINYSGLYDYLYTPYVLFLAAFAFFNFVFSYKKCDKDDKKQLKFFFSGIAVVFFLGILFALVIPRITGSQAYYRVGNYSTIILTVFTTYAILRTNFMSRQLIVAEFFVVLILMGLIVDTIISNSGMEVALKSLILLGMIYLANVLLRAIREDQEKNVVIKKLNKTLEDANLKLKAIDAMKTEFVSLASHELLTPISAIEGYLSMILDEKMVKITDKKALEYLDYIAKSSRRLARLVTDLLNVSRIEEGRLLVEKIEANVTEIIDSAIAEIKIKADKAGISISTDTKDTAKTEVYVDPDKIKEVLINLCSNAIKYNKEGGSITITSKIMPTNRLVQAEDRFYLFAEKDKKTDGSIANVVHENSRQIVGDDQLVIAVKDSGIGVDKKEIGHLFKKFSRLGNWSTQEVQGTGLGLYISKALVEMHHGRIWVESEGRGKGSTFYFSLPLVQNKAELIDLDKSVPRSNDAKPLAKRGDVETI